MATTDWKKTGDLIALFKDEVKLGGVTPDTLLHFTHRDHREYTIRINVPTTFSSPDNLTDGGKRPISAAKLYEVLIQWRSQKIGIQKFFKTFKQAQAFAKQYMRTH